jgi:hypothetical protein
MIDLVDPGNTWSVATRLSGLIVDASATASGERSPGP